VVALALKIASYLNQTFHYTSLACLHDLNKPKWLGKTKPK